MPWPSIRRPCHMTGAESRGSLGRPGLHPAKPELCCAPRSPSMSHQSSLLGKKAPLRQWGMSSQSSSSQCSFPLSCASPTLLSGQQGVRTVGIQVWYQHILLEKKAISTGVCNGCFLLLQPHPYIHRSRAFSQLHVLKGSASHPAAPC